MTEKNKLNARVVKKCFAYQKNKMAEINRKIKINWTEKTSVK